VAGESLGDGEGLGRPAAVVHLAGSRLVGAVGAAGDAARGGVDGDHERHGRHHHREHVHREHGRVLVGERVEREAGVAGLHRHEEVVWQRGAHLVAAVGVLVALDQLREIACGTRRGRVVDAACTRHGGGAGEAEVRERPPPTRMEPRHGSWTRKM